MTARTMKWIPAVLTALALLLSTQPAEARSKKPTIELNAQGQQLEKKYTALYESLKAGLSEALPAVDERAQAMYQQALADEAKAKAQLAEAHKQLGSINSKRGLIGHAKNHWIPKADRNIAKAKSDLKNAKTDAEREAAQKSLEYWEKDRANGVQALKDRTAAYEQAKKDEPKFRRLVEQSKRDLEQSQRNVESSLRTLRLERVLASSRLDTRLAKFAVLHHATPRGLAGYAQQGAEQRKHIDRLLADDELMLEMAYAEGAKDGNYGRAVEIYDAIQASSPKAKDGVFQRLALAIALEHATPIAQRNPEAAAEAPKSVDPVARYKHYENAYLGKELDPFFDRHSAWALRYVVDGNEPDETLVWGREMLRNYRPDHITTKDDRWRYVALVRTCVRYGSQENKNDKPELQFYQNILMNGGICGRRAFIGRFILRSFGVPTVRRPQKGHAALARWTPGGWVPVLGGGWGSGWAPTKGTSDLDFLAVTQARQSKDYIRVLRGQWIGDLNGETRRYGLNTGKTQPEFWNSVALNTQRQIIERTGAKALAAVGEELGEANESKVKYPFESAKVTEADRKISIDRNGVITIPAAATSTPTRSTGKILFLNSSLGGQQLTYNRNGGDQDFEYTFDAPKAGKYMLTMRVVTPGWKQNLRVLVNGGNAVEMELPHTVGLWKTTEAIQIELKAGKNTLRFTRKGVKQEVAAKGFSIRDYTLTPAKDRS